MKVRAWVPCGILLAGVALLSGGTTQQRDMPLVMSLADAVPRQFGEYVARDIEVSPEEQQAAGMSSYVMRAYEPAQQAEGADAAGGFSIYVGYYERQSQGKTIHSPRNCLPGGGWEPLTSSREMVETSLGPVPVNRYLIGNGPAKALVLYWYQGRGRVAANEYLVKWDLLRDQALYGRSDEALVRIIVPVTGSEDAAYNRAVNIAAGLVPAVDRALPGRVQQEK
jgi:EpsI family protein